MRIRTLEKNQRHKILNLQKDKDKKYSIFQKTGKQEQYKQNKMHKILREKKNETKNSKTKNSLI